MHDVVDITTAMSPDSFMWQLVTPVGGFGGLQLVDFKERDHTVHELLPEAFAKLSKVTGIRALPVLFPALPTAGRFDIEMVVLSSDSAFEMEQYANQMVAAAFASGKPLTRSQLLWVPENSPRPCDSMPCASKNSVGEEKSFIA